MDATEDVRGDGWYLSLRLEFVPLNCGELPVR